jgi:hypothetical protein
MVLLVSIYRHGYITILLPALLAPVLFSMLPQVFASLTWQRSLISNYLPDNTVLTVTTSPLGGDCIHVKYGLMGLSGSGNGFMAQYIVIKDISMLNISGLIIKSLSNPCSGIYASIPYIFYRDHELDTGFTALLNNGSIGVCPCYIHSGLLEDTIILIGEVDGAPGYLCKTSASIIVGGIINSLVSSVVLFMEKYSMIILLAYIPVLIIVDEKILRGVIHELRILHNQGVGIRMLASSFAAALTMLSTLMALYSYALSYLLILLGLRILSHYSGLLVFSMANPAMEPIVLLSLIVIQAFFSLLISVRGMGIVSNDSKGNL